MGHRGGCKVAAIVGQTAAPVKGTFEVHGETDAAPNGLLVVRSWLTTTLPGCPVIVSVTQSTGTLDFSVNEAYVWPTVGGLLIGDRLVPSARERAAPHVVH